MVPLHTDVNKALYEPGAIRRFRKRAKHLDSQSRRLAENAIRRWEKHQARLREGWQ